MIKNSFPRSPIKNWWAKLIHLTHGRRPHAPGGLGLSFSALSPCICLPGFLCEGEQLPCLSSHLGTIAASFAINGDWSVSCTLWLINNGRWEGLINSQEERKPTSLPSEWKWSCLEGLWASSLCSPLQVWAAPHCSHWQCSATCMRFTSEWMSSARWQDWGQQGQILSDWTQAELTRILKERLMPLILQQSGTFWNNQRNWIQQIGMLEHSRLEIKLSNVFLHWQGFQTSTWCQG